MTAEQLGRQLGEIKSFERQAYTLYEGLLPLLHDDDDREIVRGIMGDELRHERLAQDAIDLLHVPSKKPISL